MYELYELLLYNLYKKCQIIRIRMYEFVQKKAKKKKRKLGFQPGTNMACNRRSGTPSTPPPHLSVPILFIYRTIRRPSEKTDYTISPVWHIVNPK